MTSYLGKIRKALVAAVGSFAAGYATVASAGPVTGNEWLALSASAVAVGLATWFIPNETGNPGNGSNTPGPTVTKP